MILPVLALLGGVATAHAPTHSARQAQQPADTATTRGARAPSFATDGRMVLSVGGDLFVRPAASGPLVRITEGSAWDRDPVFSKDGSTIIFASDRGGNYDLWRVRVGPQGATGAPEAIARTPQHETMPTVAPDGSIAFVRGAGNAGRVFIRDAAGAERRLNTREAAESAPAFSPDGARVAYVSVTETGRRVVVRPVAGAGTETVVNSDRNADRLAWAPGGDRVAFSSRAGVFVAPPDGRWTNFVSARHGDLAWSPDGRTIAIAEYDESNLGYNGDPDRGLDRSTTDRPNANERLYTVVAPSAPDQGLAETPLAVPARERAARNGDTFDRVWDRSASLYFASDSSPDGRTRRAHWEAVKAKYRPLAVAATSDSALQRVVYNMLQNRPPLRAPASGRAAVSSAHPVATEAGLEILRRGGNVVDAAAAVSFALGVVEPDASGIGGYGEMVIAQKGKAPTLIEFMSRVPEEGGLSNTALLQNGRYPSDGPVLANVPGTVAGMYTAVQKYGSGKVTWSDILQPAIRAARNGYIVSDGLATTLATEREHFAKYEGSRALFFRNGKPMVAGDTLRNPDLAWTLERIAKDGADGFYKGEVAKKWIDDIRPKGNAMKLTDLARYFAPEREPVSGTYRQYTVFSSAPPVSGGADLVGRLNLLERFPSPKKYTDDAATLHAALSAWFLVPSSRNRIADPALWPVDYAPIINKDTARVRWGCFDPGKALRPSDTRGDTLPCLRAAGPASKAAPAGSGRDGDDVPNDASLAPCGDDHAAEMTYCHSSGTTAYTVADNDGNVVAVTQTLGTWGGNFYVTPGLGFLSNDKLTSYGTDPSQYGSRLPFARHGSTLAPTIVFKGKTPIFAVGAAGNAWITSAVYQTLLGAMDYGLGPQQALELPRFLPGGGGAPAAVPGAPVRPGGPPYTIQLEDGFAPEVIARLRELGYEVSFVSMRGELREGYGAAVRIDGKTVTAGADPRRAGAAGAIRP
ncbi:MAG: gamma-glutamyltransferase [Gemmatimonadota bacterium]